MFKIVGEDKTARAGIFQTAHGQVETPIFMPVGTQATVKALDPNDLKEIGVQIILGNTYHLYLRPGSELIKQMGGLHKFMAWQGPILTDSGGFQAFSLGAMIEHGVRKIGGAKNPIFRIRNGRDLKREAKNGGVRLRDNSFELSGGSLVNKIIEEGVEFTSHLDGTKHLFTPEISIKTQLNLGSDICLVLDELLSPLHNRDYANKSLDRTHRWEERSFRYFKDNLKKSINSNAQIFGILQGVYDKSIRQKEANWVAAQNFDGISIGGSFGTSQYYRDNKISPSGSSETGTNWASIIAINQTLDWVTPFLPKHLPRHALGIGEVRNIFDCIERGVDMFDCVAPTRRARNGSLYISPGNGGKIANMFALSIAKAEFMNDKKPIDPGCACSTCQRFSRSYLRYLYLAKELLYYRLASIHNVYFMINLTQKIRQAILNKNFVQFKQSWEV